MFCDGNGPRNDWRRQPSSIWLKSVVNWTHNIIFSDVFLSPHMTLNIFRWTRLDELPFVLPGRDMDMLYLNPHSLYLQFVEPQDFPRYHLVCKDWHDACVLLLLEHRANGHPDAYAIKLPMSLAVFKEVSAAKALLDPTCTTDPQAWCHRSLHATIDATVAEVLNALSGTVPLLPPLTAFDANVRADLYKSTQPFLLHKSDTVFSAWPCIQKWRPKDLHSTYGNLMFRCGEDEEGRDVFITIKAMLEYGLAQYDDTPLYIFDHKWNNGMSTAMLGDYNQQIKNYFPDNLMQYMEDRPPHRWLLVGPKGSGTDVHRDPAGTVAWNLLISGQNCGVFCTLL